MSYRSICVTRGHILLKDMDGMSCRRHVLQEDMSCRRLCLTCGHLLLEDISFIGTCLNPMHLV